MISSDPMQRKESLEDFESNCLYRINLEKMKKPDPWELSEL